MQVRAVGGCMKGETPVKGHNNNEKTMYLP
jgi:hypothetical protein